jgi:hypothetical protein
MIWINKLVHPCLFFNLARATCSAMAATAHNQREAATDESSTSALPATTCGAMRIRGARARSESAPTLRSDLWPPAMQNATGGSARCNVSPLGAWGGGIEVGLTNRACSEFARRASAMPCPKGESQGEGVVIQPHTSRGQILPSRSRMTRMVRTTPNPPVGP